jgi:hypothetical protein
VNFPARYGHDDRPSPKVCESVGLPGLENVDEASVDRKPSDPIPRVAHFAAPTAAFPAFGRSDRSAGMAETPESLKAAANALFKGTRLSVFSRPQCPDPKFGGRRSFHLRVPS